MESKLIINNPIPIKAIPEKDLNVVLMGSFLDWISATLSLNEDAVTKLEYALPAIKEHCWSMGFPEIKKMIEMYADGKLSVKPIPNHFDRIKFGEVAKAYNELQRTKPKKMDEEEYKKEMDDILVIQCFDAFIQDRKIKKEYYWVYTYLEEQINATDKDKKMLFKMGKDQKLTDEEAIAKAKLVLLRRFFERIEAKDKHIKEYL